jgi:hypothetical protein
MGYLVPMHRRCRLQTVSLPAVTGRTEGHAWIRAGVPGSGHGRDAAEVVRCGGYSYFI